MNDTSAPAERAPARVRIPSLFEIFFGKFANWFRQLRDWRKKGMIKRALQARRRSTRLETLEPRLLLSTDITYGAAALDALNVTVKFTEHGGTDYIQLYDNDTSSVIDEQAIDGAITLNITGGQLQDTLIIDFGFDGAQDATTRQMNVIFENGHPWIAFNSSSFLGMYSRIWREYFNMES